MVKHDEAPGHADISVRLKRTPTKRKYVTIRTTHLENQNQTNKKLGEKKT